MAISITCGGKGGEDASATTGGESTADPSGTSGASDGLPTTGETSPITSSASESEGDATGSATSVAEATSVDPGASTGGDSTDDGEATAGTGGDSTGGGVPDDATVDDSCAPNDGAALEFRIGLAEPICGATWSGDTLRVLLYQGAPLAPGVYPLGGGLGAASFDDGQGLVFGSTGSLTIESWTEEAVVGSYTVTLEDQSEHAGSFVGPHCVTMPMCG